MTGEARGLSPITLAVDVLLFTVRQGSLYVMLGRRTEPPFAGCLALPGGIVRGTENAKTAAERVLGAWLPAEEAHLEQLYTFTAVDRDPRSRVVSIAYLALVPPDIAQEAVEKAAGDVFLLRVSFRETLKLFDGAGAEVTCGMAFDHAHIIRTAIRRMRGKIDYTGISLGLLENQKRFSMAQLQQIFEAVLDRSMDPSNFRRDILKRDWLRCRLRQLPESQVCGRGRPAALYEITDDPSEYGGLT